jgi:hypothetical protein
MDLGAAAAGKGRAIRKAMLPATAAGGRAGATIIRLDVEPVLGNGAEIMGEVGAGGVCVVRGKGGGGAVRDPGGGVWVLGIECACEGLAEIGRGGGRLGGGAGGASLARTGSNSGVGVESISSITPLTSSSEPSSVVGTAALVSPSSLLGLLAVSSS